MTVLQLILYLSLSGPKILVWNRSLELVLPLASSSSRLPEQAQTSRMTVMVGGDGIVLSLIEGADDVRDCHAA